MKKQNILFDVHGCIADFVGGCVEYVNLQYPEIVWDKTHVVTWEFWHGIPCDNAKDYIINGMAKHDFIANLPVIEEGLEAFQKLVRLGHDVRICTTPLLGESESSSKQAVTKWVEKYLGKTLAQKMIFSFDKTQIFADVIIDDKPSLTAGKEDIRFNHWAIVDHLYNRSLPENTKLLPIARIKNDWSNCDEVFAQLGLI